MLPYILRSLPLKNDMTENETVYRCLLRLLEMNQEDAVSCKAEIKRIFQEACTGNSKAGPELKSELAAAIGSL